MVLVANTFIMYFLVALSKKVSLESVQSFEGAKCIETRMRPVVYLKYFSYATHITTTSFVIHYRGRRKPASTFYFDRLLFDKGIVLLTIDRL